MIPLILVFLVIGLFFWFYDSIISFFRKKKKTINKEEEPIISDEESKVFTEINEEGEEIEEFPHYDKEKDLYYKTIDLYKLLPRETYLHATIVGKYRGESLNDINWNDSYTTEIYEARLHLIEDQNCNCINDLKTYCNGIHKDSEGNFDCQFSNKLSISENQLPNEYILEKEDGSKYRVKLKNVTIYDFESDRTLHQTEDNLVFGTIKGRLIGNLLDFVEKYEEGRLYNIKDKVLSEIPLSNITDKSGENIIVCNEKGRFTAYAGPAGFRNLNFEYSSSLPIKKKEIKESNIQKSIKKSKTNNINLSQGCFSYFWQIIGVIIFIGLLIAFLPTLGYVIPFLIIGFLLYFLPGKLWGWLYSLICGLYFLFLGWLIVSSLNFNHNFDWLRFPKYTIENDNKEEIIAPEEKFIKENGKIKDTLMIYQKAWQDYKGVNYNGKYSIKKSDYLASKSYKQKLYQQFRINQNYSYNYMIHLLKEYDKSRLAGVYEMFDTIRNERKLNSVEFADMVISFVQDFDYYLILPEECDSRLYQDQFVKNYLQNKQGPCYPNQPFGINTPVEFLGNRMADCDTRTLTIYTILSHYNYDVIVLSSDYYGHSLFGINLPYNGQYKYTYESIRYTLFETTVKKSSPGAISNEISNMNHWEISLKSK